MGLLPLEFSDCMLDSPYFRENLKAHEKQLDQTSTDIKAIIKDIQDVLDAAKILSKAKRTLAHSLSSFQFDCLGTSLTDDEVIISNSLREFSKMLSLVEDEMDKVLEHAQDKFIQPLVTFRKEQIGSVRKIKKDFDKQTGKFCAAQDRYVNLGSKKEESLAEAAESVRHEKRNLSSSSLEYVYLMHVVQERKKFEFVEALLSFIQTWSNFYKHGYSTAEKSSSYTEDLKSRVQKTRENYSATIEQYASLKQKMITGHQDPGLLNRMYTRQGYLYVFNKKNIIGASQWSKHYCQYQSNSRTLTMIPYTQLHGKITTTETINVTSCICKEDSTEKFRFVVSGEETNNPGNVITHTIQAMSEYERKHWVEAMGGTWPAINTLQRIRADSVEENLNSMAFTFLKDCLAELENRGLTDQGLYRVGGVVSKVKKLLNVGLDPQSGDTPLALSDPKQWESKTIASAVKQYFRDLNKPLMTHHLYTHFIEAIKHETENERLQELQLVINKLPIAGREILKVLIRHLHKVASKSDTNLMTASNLGVCFGPTLLRPREETVASIMDIKFCNEVVEILIHNCDRFFPALGSSPDELQKHFRKNSNDASSHHGSQHQSRRMTPKREQRGSSTPKRTQSFSSFSQLSTNSLPDIKEFKDRAIAALTNARNQSGDKSSKSYISSHQNGHSITLASPSTVKHAILSKLPSPTKVLSRAPSTQDDLMASLEMMNSLAADLPTSSPLKRSHTIQARRGNRPQQPQQEHQSQVVAVSLSSSKKPPLPKSSAPSTPTSIPTTPPSFTLHQVNHGQQCNNHPVPNSVPSHQISSAVQSNYDPQRHHHHHHYYHAHNPSQTSYIQNQGQEGYDSSSTCSSSNGSTSNRANSSTMSIGKGYRAPPPVPNSPHIVPPLLRNNSVPSIPLSNDKSLNQSITNIQMAKLSYDETINARKWTQNVGNNNKLDNYFGRRNENYENAYITAATRPLRPTELFVRQISLSEVQTINGKNVHKAKDTSIERIRLESSESSSPTAIRSTLHSKDIPPSSSSTRGEQEDCETPPPIPTRRYRRIFVNPPNFVTKTRNGSGSDATGSIESDMGISKEHPDQTSPSSLDARRRLPQGYASSSSNTTDSSPGLVRANMSMDSGVAIASPSPPTADSGIAISPPIIAKKVNRSPFTLTESNSNATNTRKDAKVHKETSNNEDKNRLQKYTEKKDITLGHNSLKDLPIIKASVTKEDNISVTSSEAFSGAGVDSDTSVSKYDNVSERKRLSSDSLSKTSTLVAAAAAIAAANHTSPADGIVSSETFDHVTDGEDEEGGNEAEDEASDFDASFEEENCDNDKCCGNDEDDASSNVSDESNSSSEALDLEGSDESECESNCSELIRIQKQRKQQVVKSSSNHSLSEHDANKETSYKLTNMDDFSSPASLTETRPELVAQIDQEIEINDHYKAVSMRNKSKSTSDPVTSSQFRKSGPYENYIPPPPKYVDEKRVGHETISMTSSTSLKDIPKIFHGKEYIKKENPYIAERKGGDDIRASKNNWEQQSLQDPSQQSAKNSDGIADTTDHVNGSSTPLSLHAQGLSSIRRLLAAGQTSNV